MHPNQPSASQPQSQTRNEKGQSKQRLDTWPRSFSMCSHCRSHFRLAKLPWWLSNDSFLAHSLQKAREHHNGTLQPCAAFSEIQSPAAWLREKKQGKLTR